MKDAKGHGRKPVVDFYLGGGGSVYLLTPNTVAACEWLDDHIQDDAQFHGYSLAVEHRYIDDVVRGIQADGLLVE